MPTGTHNYFQTNEDAEKSAWQQQVDKLKKAASDFTGLFNQLQNLKMVAAKNPATKAEFDSLMSRGSTVKTQVETVTRAIDSAIATAKSVMGENALHGLAGNMSGMGFLPLVPIAIIAGAVALVGGWNAQAMIMRTKLQKMQLEEAVKAGATPEQISRITESQAASNQDIGFSGQIGAATGQLIKFAAIGLLLYWGFPKLMEMIKNGR